MNELKLPIGINFHCSESIAIGVLSKDLCCLVAFLQDKNPYEKLMQYEDWREHDGRHFVKGEIDFHALFSIVGKPNSLYDSMTGEEYVCIGIASENITWYLRFYAYWDDDKGNPEGNYDVTLPDEWAIDFRAGIIPTLNADIEEESSQSYFERIIL